jgi:enoyl-CoA hydratase
VSEPEVLIERTDGLGRITLNRPRALNALTFAMAGRITDALRAWADDARVREVVITGAGERAFCAGGDVRSLYDARMGGGGAAILAAFFRREYRLNQMIRRYPKPYVAILDGIAMGGGVGLSVHGSVRIATARTGFAMPETGIGFFPDVGGGWALARAPGRIGPYLALSGARIGAADCLYAGLATHYVPDGALAELEGALGTAPIADLLARFAGEAGPAPLADKRAVIDRCFGAPTVEAVLEALDAEGSDWARELAAGLRTRSPTSLKVAFRQLDEAARLDFEADMVMEYRLSQRFMAGHDFFEGVRAMLIDRDNAPAWRPARLDQVTDEMVAAYFAPLEVGDLDFD